ncbi:MarR family transcriptional regulator [Bradyrhizobium sp. CCGUVB1N3]|nr:MarR family transcriptional regulator [Bradyrhizobium sp. CCGUVB1N3]MCP3476733.1 MarR family transcriptional regulator [Bradyrhizobium sp. CCGUVB1N3]
MLRRLLRRHEAIFSAEIGPELTPPQWAALSKLSELGACTQNLLGRLTSMDAATIKGVVDRLESRRLVNRRQDQADTRRMILSLTREGKQLVAGVQPMALAVSERTLSPLASDEQVLLLELLKRLR